MKLIIAGTRTFNNYELLETTLDEYLTHYKVNEIVSGTCSGADILGEKYAKLHNIPVKQFPANWNLYGKSAGPIRNKQMAEYADACIVFWDGKSKGTLSMINLAKEYNLDLMIIYTDSLT